MITHTLQHPNVHYGALEWSEAQTLHVACAYSNPCRWQTRRRLFDDFRRHMAASANVVLHVGEIAYGDRPFEVTSADHPLDLQFRTDHVLWHKENLLNLIVQRFPPGWRYGAIIDGDFHFTRHDWALETIHLLQLYDWVQLFRSYSDLAHDHQPLNTQYSFAHNWLACRNQGPRQSYYAWLGSPGGAWAFRQDAFNLVGSLLDVCILGSGDYHMATGLIGERTRNRDTMGTPAGYRDAIQAWQVRAAPFKHRIGVLDCHAIHHFHGSKKRRGYDRRWRLLADHRFDPVRDLHRDHQGLWQMTEHKWGLRRAILDYFLSRDEDGR
jgi:hypothetical protein